MSAYMKIIETSQTWVCPEDGDYEVICVAGGMGGVKAVIDIPNANMGGTTSFGAYLTASGCFSSQLPYYYNTTTSLNTAGSRARKFRHTGYTLKDFNSHIPLLDNVDEYQEIGYGAGGGSTTAGCFGLSGKMNITQVALTKGESIACTIGQGGLAIANQNTNTYVTDGTDGVIVIRKI